MNNSVRETLTEIDFIGGFFWHFIKDESIEKMSAVTPLGVILLFPPTLNQGSIVPVVMDEKGGGKILVENQEGSNFQ